MGGHTLGPWAVSGVRLTSFPRIGRDCRLLQVGPDGDRLALVFFDMQTGRGQADARLIAGAPELLACVSDVLTECDRSQRLSFALQLRMRAAIASAKGGAA